MARKRKLPSDELTVSKLGVFGVILFMVSSIGRIGELIPFLGKIPLAKVALLMMLIPFVLEYIKSKEKTKLTQKDKKELITPINPYFIAFLFAIGIGVLLSTGTKNSTNYLIQQFTTSLALYAFIAFYAKSERYLFIFVNAMIVSSMMLVIPLIKGQDVGRAGLAGAFDPNDTAAILVGMLPVLWVITRKFSGFKKMISYGVIFAFIMAILYTQSRGGLIGMVLVFVLLFLTFASKYSLGHKIRIFFVASLVSVLVGGIAINFLDEETKDRLSTVFSLEDDYNATEEGRFGIWGRGWDAFRERPWGWGLAQYSFADIKMGGNYKTAHNIFFQVGVELGILGLATFVTLLFMTRKSLKKIFSEDKENSDAISMLSGGLFIGLTGFVFCALFLSHAYFNFLYVILGLSQAVISIYNTRKLNHRELSELP